MKTYDSFRVIKASLREAAGGEGDGEGESADAVEPSPTDYLSPELFQRIGEAAATCDQPGKLSLAARALEALREIVAGRSEEITANA